MQETVFFNISYTTISRDRSSIIYIHCIHTCLLLWYTSNKPPKHHIKTKQWGILQDY